MRRSDEWYRELLRDHDRLARLSAVYRGRHSVLDAAWWAAHPTETAPSGAASPASARDELRRRLYSNHAARAGTAPETTPGTSAGTAAQDTAAQDAAALRALETQLAADARAFDDALDAAGEALAPGLSAEIRRSAEPFSTDTHISARTAAGGIGTGTSTDTDTGTGTAVDTAARPGDPEPSSAAQPLRRARLAFGVLLAAACVAVGAVGTLAVSGGLGPAASTVSNQAASPASPTPQPARSRFQLDPASGDGPLGINENPNAPAVIFTRQQQASDLPNETFFPTNLTRDSFRRLSSGQFTPGSIYAAIAIDGRVCLVALVADNASGATCASAESVALNGLQVTVTTSTTDTKSTGAKATYPTDLTAQWWPDGLLSVGQSTH